MKIVFGLLLSCAVSLGYSQNLVKNGSFEELGQKVKGLGAISASEGWSPANGAPADLFTPESKVEDAKSPSNIYGKEKAYEGNNYAGIRAYSYKGKDPRTYITGTLESKLEAGKEYCAKFQLSLSEDSKYAISDVAGVFSSEPFEMGEMSYSILMDPSVALNKPTVVTRQLYWEDVCNVYEAGGEEQFLTIGVFVTDKQVQYKKVKRPGDFSGAQQNHAYYYIDNVVVTALAEGEKCDCEKEVFIDEPKIVRSTVVSNVSASDVSKEIEQLVLSFPEGSFQLDPNQEAMEEVLKYIKLDSDLRLKVIGHISEAEMKQGIKNPRIKTLATARATQVIKYFEEQKIAKTRFVVEDAGSYETVESDGLEKGAANQSVTFKVIR